MVSPSLRHLEEPEPAPARAGVLQDCAMMATSGSTPSSTEGEWPYLRLDTSHLEVCDGGRIVSVPAVMAVAVDTEGRREIVGIGPSKAEPFWAFLKGLGQRGLKPEGRQAGDLRRPGRVARVLGATLRRCIRGLHRGPCGRRTATERPDTMTASDLTPSRNPLHGEVGPIPDGRDHRAPTLNGRSFRSGRLAARSCWSRASLWAQLPSTHHGSRNARDMLSLSGFIKYWRNVRSDVLM